MHHPVFSSPVAMATQRNRRLLLTLPACAIPVLSACGGGADISYETEQALYVVGEAITPNTPTLTSSNPRPGGHTSPTFAVKPPLPAGLSLDPQTGVIAGTPTTLRRQGTYTITAKNNKGSAETQLRITVTGRGSWTPIETTAVDKLNACIAALADGKVLVVGGLLGGAWTDAAQIFDPVTASWSVATAMPLIRESPMCIALRDGRVLVYSGDIYGSLVARSDVYDPGTNSWTEAGGMVVPRRFPSGCLLADGKVLATGGSHPEAPGGLNTVELYDPSTAAWTMLPKPMSSARYAHASVPMPGGKSVLLVGGYDLSGIATTAELYTLDGSASRSIPSGPSGGYAQGVQLDDGSVLVVTDAAVSWRLNPRTFTWTTSPLVSARRHAQMRRLADGRVLLAGGGGGLNTAEIYNPDLNIWTVAARMVEERLGAVSSLLNDGRVLMFGGGSRVYSTELYTP